MRFRTAVRATCVASLALVCTASTAAARAPQSSGGPAMRASVTVLARTQWVRPVPGPIVRRYIAPATPYGPGHRGIDFRTTASTNVVAAGGGRVLFAGSVAGDFHVTIRHPTSGWVVGYSNLASVAVRSGQLVRAGDVIGRAGGHLVHHDPTTVHVSLRIDGQYRDPATLLGVAGRPRVHLVPLG